MGQWSVLCQLYFNKMLIGQQPGKKQRQSNQEGSRGGAMRTEDFGKKTQSTVVTQTQRKPDTEQARCDCFTKKGTKPRG